MALDTASQRQAALDALLPAWRAGRRRVFEVGSAVKGLQAELKEHKEALARTEANLDHAAQCRQIACLLCEELALNGGGG